jgi:hypothetical protein
MEQADAVGPTADGDNDMLLWDMLLWDMLLWQKERMPLLCSDEGA